MADTNARRWLMGSLAAAGALLLTLCLGCALPRLILPDGTERLSGPEREAAQLARSQLRSEFRLPQSLATTQLRVTEVRPDPADCDWSGPKPATGIVFLQTYTLFGIPLEQWTVTCHSSWSSHEPPLTE